VFVNFVLCFFVGFVFVSVFCFLGVVLLAGGLGFLVCGCIIVCALVFVWFCGVFFVGLFCCFDCLGVVFVGC